MPHEFTTSHVTDALAVFRQYKWLAERAVEQVPDEQLFTMLDTESNSIAIIVKHIAGNLRSRWTDFLTSDGEKPNRNRDGEFVEPPASRAQLLADWEDGWSRLFSTLEKLQEQDLGRTVTIRSEKHSVMQAINRQIAHNAYHVGQIVILAKHYASNQWRSLSIPRNQSEEFNRKIASGELNQR